LRLNLPPPVDGRFAGAVAPESRPRMMLHGEVHGVPAMARDVGLPADAPAAEVLAEAWARDGPAMLARLDGVFAAAVADNAGVHLYRDRSGLRDVYWLEHAGRAQRFASSTAGLFGGSMPALAPRGLQEYLRMLDLAAPATVFEDVHAVEPGQLVSLRPDAAAQRTPLPAKVPAAGDMPERFDDAVQALDARLRDAIAARLDDASRPAAFLSGGVDSSLLCAMAARLRPDTVALTVGFEGASDESEAAARVARHLGLRHEVLRFDRAALVRAFERLAAASDQPLADPSTPVTQLAVEAARARFDVVLDGTGADEAVGLMPPRHVRIAAAWCTLLPTAWRMAVARTLRGSGHLCGYAPLFDFEHPVETQLRWNGFDRHQVAELCGLPADAVDFRPTRLYRTYERFPRRAHYGRASALNDAMPCERLTQAMLVSRYAMRFPFTAPAVDGLLRQLRTEWRWQPGQPKRILRELLARYLPRELWDRPKHGFDFPVASFLEGQDAALVHRHVLAPAWAGRAGLQPQVVAAWGRRFVRGDRQATFKVWALVVLGAWLEAHTAA
jgi:asparagine synthase (glutamine-hydrolysing)